MKEPTESRFEIVSSGRNHSSYMSLKQQTSFPYIRMYRTALLLGQREIWGIVGAWRMLTFFAIYVKIRKNLNILENKLFSMVF